VEIYRSAGLVYFLFLHCTSNYTPCDHGPTTYPLLIHLSFLNFTNHTKRPVLPPVLCLAFHWDPSTLEAKYTISLQNVANTYLTTQHHIPENLKPQQNCCRNLRSHTNVPVCNNICQHKCWTLYALTIRWKLTLITHACAYVLSCPISV
jgi:hypothetical protein